MSGELHPVRHTHPTILWCGPAAISAITGNSTGDIHRVLAEVSGKRRVQGVRSRDLVTAMLRMGWQLSRTIDGDRQTLKKFSAQHAPSLLEAPYIIEITGHYLAVSNGLFADSIQTSPAPLLDSPDTQRKVIKAMRFDPLPGFVFQPPARAPRLTRKEDSPRRALNNAKRLAAQHGVQINIEQFDGYRRFYVRCPALHDTPSDPFYGNHYVDDGHEVLERVEAYARTLNTPVR